jgi:hypothetical protein
VRTFEVPGVDHFSGLAALTPLLARKVAADRGPTCDIALSAGELGAQLR